MSEGPQSEGEAPPPGPPQTLTTVVVRFRVPGQNVQLQSGDLELSRHDRVMVETDRGPAVATVLMPPETTTTTDQLRKVLRLATGDDERVAERNTVREGEAFSFCAERIRALELPMKLINVELAHSGTRAIFHFTSAQRVDFRALVKDLARRFHTRIEMKQIGVRDAARHTGGTGLCGRELCCSTWLPAFEPVSIRMAKDQGLSLNHDKLSGVCGRLRCCLRYEQDLYHEARKKLPKLGKRVVTPDGEGRVRDVNVLQNRVRVQLGSGVYTEFAGDEVSRPTEPPRPRAKSGGENEASEAKAGRKAEAKPSKPGEPKRRKRRRRRKRNEPGGSKD